MTQDEWRQHNHDFLQEFLSETKGDDGDITSVIKATMAQFLSEVKRRFNLLAAINNGMISTEDLVRVQVEELRRCVVDIHQVFNGKERMQ